MFVYCDDLNKSLSERFYGTLVFHPVLVAYFGVIIEY